MQRPAQGAGPKLLHLYRIQELPIVEGKRLSYRDLIYLKTQLNSQVLTEILRPRSYD